MKEFKRSTTDRMLFGVCGGLGEYFGIDANLIRLGFIIFSFFGGAAVLLYLALALIMPGESSQEIGFSSLFRKSREYVSSAFSEKNGDGPINVTPTANQNKNMFGLIIAFFGVYLLLQNFNLLTNINYTFVGSILFIVAGFIIFLKKRISMNSLLILLILLILVSIFSSINPFHVLPIETGLR